MTKELEDKIAEETAKRYVHHVSEAHNFKEGAKWAINTILPDVLSWMQTLDIETWRKWKEYNYQPEDIMKEYFEYLKTKEMTLQQKALEIAITQIGKEENPIGSNWGHPVQDYLASVGINFPASWCMAFMYWCFNEAAKALDVDNPMIKSGGVLNEWQQNHFEHKVTLPQPGDIFIQDHGGGLGHCGIIESTDGNELHTIEGNTNNNGSREGIAVERKVRNMMDAKIIGYLRYL